MSWIEDAMDKFRHEMQQAQLEIETKQMGITCHFCDKITTKNNTFTFQGYPICNECNKKLADRVKLILKFE